jgi:predicted transcriptional regulator
MARVRVLNWNGHDVPPELRELPAGRYVLAEYDVELSAEQEAGLEEGLDEIDRGQTEPWQDVRAQLDDVLNPRR